VEAAYGKGHWIYIALGLWRQLPAGTDGAYPILANLISLGAKPAPAAPVATKPPAPRTTAPGTPKSAPTTPPAAPKPPA
jgi:hypothetical protein